MILELIDEAVRDGAGFKAACVELGLTARTIQRWRAQGIGEDRREGPKSSPANKIAVEERLRVLAIATSPEFRDCSPNVIVPRLADRGEYVASEATFYRVLREEKLMEHRSTARPPRHKKPRELVAEAPNQVWAWDITYLPTTVRGQYYYLYMILVIFSRKIVGWEVNHHECMELSAPFVRRVFEAERVAPSQLVLHSDNGGPMKGATMKATLQDLRVMQSLSRPRVSDDNPFPEALFRTVKYCPEYLSTPFESIDDARAWVEEFVHWYNHEHLHSGIRYVTPADRHADLDAQILERRHQVYIEARRLNPNRWSADTRDWSRIDRVVLNPSHGRSLQHAS
jgi:transposase InsO family protein